MFSTRKATDLNPRAPNIMIMMAEITTEYVIHNITGSEREFPLRVEMGSAPTEELDNFVRLEKLSVDNTDINVRELRVSSSNTRDKYFEYKMRMAAGSEHRVFAHYHKVKMASDTEISRSLYPSDGMTLVVILPEQAKKVGAYAAHREKLKEQFSDIANGRYEWVLNAPVLPYQGIAFWWMIDEAMMERKSEEEKSRGIASIFAGEDMQIHHGEHEGLAAPRPLARDRRNGEGLVGSVG